MEKLIKKSNKKFTATVATTTITPFILIVAGTLANFIQNIDRVLLLFFIMLVIPDVGFYIKTKNGKKRILKTRSLAIFLSFHVNHFIPFYITSTQIRRGYP